MTPRLASYVSRSCRLASFAYAAKMKRLGHNYFFGAVAALYTASDDTRILYDGRMPSTVLAAHAA